MQLAQVNNSHPINNSNWMHHRKSACIMFTDIVGYTKLVENDMEQAMSIVVLNKELHKRLVSRHDGQLIKEMGDGMLISFNSAVEAVNCAKELQQNLQEIEHFSLRIGIHMGEVIFSNHDVFGIVVNIASRIQNYADEGQILVSESVADQLATGTNIELKCLGNKRFKNVKRKIKTFLIKDTNMPKSFYPDWNTKVLGSEAGYFLRMGVTIAKSILLLAFGS